MRIWLALMFTLAPFGGSGGDSTSVNSTPKKVYVLPVRDDIMPPLVYIVRRGVKEAIEAKADLLVLDMETNGGRLDVTGRFHEVITPAVRRQSTRSTGSSSMNREAGLCCGAPQAERTTARET